LFIQLWSDLRNLYHDNKTATSFENAKLFINYSIRDIANEYDWEFLRNNKTITPSSDQEYSLNPITQLSALTANIYGIASAGADDGTIVSMFGAKINELVSSNPTITYDDTTFTVSAGVSASSTGWSDIQYFYKPVTNGSIFFTNGSTIIATLSATDTYIANDFRKINKIVDATNSQPLEAIDWSTQLEGNPSGTSNSDLRGYDYVGNGKVRFFNVSGNPYTVIYQRKPRWLVNNQDRTEFPEEFYQDIVQYAYRVYGKQFQDEATAVPDQQIDDLKKMLIGNIIRKWTNGGDNKPKRILPRGYTRAV
jgi:type IV secretory pathway protease TraF